MSIKKILEGFDSVASEYDVDRRKFIPCFDDFYLKTTEFFISRITPSSTVQVLDLGSGTGLLTACWLRYMPEAEYALVDISSQMQNIAKERFKNLTKVSYFIDDYSKCLPEYQFDFIISALSIHHLENSEKKELFENILKHLKPKGMFVNYDQFLLSSSLCMENNANVFWYREIEQTGIDRQRYEQMKARRKLDKECTVEWEMNLLQSLGFSDVTCIYKYFKFAVITASKP